jgi:hypothetical protein
MITYALKIKFSTTAGLTADGGSLRRGMVADSTDSLLAGLFSNFQHQLPRYTSKYLRVFDVVRTFRSIFQIRFSHRELCGFGFLVNRWNDQHLRRNDFALRFKEPGATEVSRSYSSEKSHILGRLDNVIDSQTAIREATPNVTGLSVVGMARPSLSNNGSQKNQTHAIRLFESLSGSPINRQQRMNSNEKDNAYQCVASRRKSDCDC